jgi:hypothetical protein
MTDQTTSRIRLSLAAFSSAICFVSHAMAGVPAVVCADAACQSAGEIDTADLARVTGKFMLPADVAGMNLNMISSWQAGNGQQLESRAGLALRLPDNGPATVQTTTGASVTAPATAATGGPAGTDPARQAGTGSGLGSVSGVVQVVQLAGNGNAAVNTAAIDVSRSPLPGVAPGASVSTASAANGAEARAAFDSAGVTLTMRIPDAGNTLQQVALANGTNIAQMIRLSADNQQVRNQLQLQLQLRAPSPAALAASGFTDAIDLLHAR